VQRQHLGVDAGQFVGRLTDLAKAREEGENVAVIAAEQFAHGRGHRP